MRQSAHADHGMGSGFRVAGFEGDLPFPDDPTLLLELSVRAGHGGARNP